MMQIMLQTIQPEEFSYERKMTHKMLTGIVFRLNIITATLTLEKIKLRWKMFFTIFSRLKTFT